MIGLLYMLVSAQHAQLGQHHMLAKLLLLFTNISLISLHTPSGQVFLRG